MATRFIAFTLFLCGAEAVASWWVWRRAPTDSIRVWYSAFWSFEAGRLHYWIPILGALLAFCIVAYALRRNGRFITWWLFSAAGVGVEVLTSVLYWRSAQASDLRNLYESIWYWHRVPQASDMGWPSFRGYLWDHLLPWAMVLSVGITIWLILDQRANHATRGK